jgi:hypothetical protein
VCIVALNTRVARYRLMTWSLTNHLAMNLGDAFPKTLEGLIWIYCC